jgi:hypothetical protein
MHLPEDEWPDPYGLARPLGKLNNTLYDIKQANREYYEEVFDFILDDLDVQASIAAPRSHLWWYSRRGKWCLNPRQHRRYHNHYHIVPGCLYWI